MQINKINSSTFTGSLCVPLVQGGQVTIKNPSDIEAIVAEDDQNTLI